MYGHLQGQLLASVNNKLEALGLPRGISSLSRSQQWLAAHRIPSSVPADAHFMKDQPQQSPNSAASAWSQAADDSIAMAVTIKAKAAAASSQFPDKACTPSDRWSGNSDSSALAAAATTAAGYQQARQVSNAHTAHAKLQALQSSGQASDQLDVQTVDLNTAKCVTLRSWSLRLGPEPQINGPSTLTPHPEVVSAQMQALTAQPQAFSAQPQACSAQIQTLRTQPESLRTQPQTLRAQPDMLSAQSALAPPEQVCNAILSTHSNAVLHCNTEFRSLPSASVQAAAAATAEAAGAIAVQTPSGMHTAQTDAAELAPAPNAAQEKTTLQPGSGYSTAQQGVTGLAAAAHISRIDSFTDASSKRSSFESSLHASAISEQGSWVGVQPGRTNLGASQSLESAAAAAGTSPALAAMQSPAAPGVMPQTCSPSYAFRPEEGSVELGSEVSVEAGKEVDLEAVAEVGFHGRVKADMEGSKGADMSASSPMDCKQASSIVGPPTGIVKASDFSSSIDGRDPEQHLPMASEHCTGRLQGSLCTDLDKPVGYLLHEHMCATGSAPFRAGVFCSAL